MLLAEMLILSVIRTKNDFFQNDFKERRFRRNIDIYAFLDKKTIFWKRSKEKYFFLEFWYFERYGQKTIFQSDLKKISFSRNVDIYGFNDNKRFIQNNLNITYFLLKILIFTYLTTINDLSKMISILRTFPHLIS